MRPCDSTRLEQGEKTKPPMPAIVSERVAKLIYPGVDPIGRESCCGRARVIAIGRIVGVVGNMRERSLSSEPTLAVYFPVRGRCLADTPVRVEDDSDARRDRAKPACGDGEPRSQRANF